MTFYWFIWTDKFQIYQQNSELNHYRDGAIALGPMPPQPSYATFSGENAFSKAIKLD